MVNKQLSDALAGVIDRIEKDAYERGYADAVQQIVSAAQAAHATPTQPNVAPARRPRKVEYGAVGKVIDSALDAFADRGVSLTDVIEHGREVFDVDLLESSTRGRLNRMAKSGELAKQSGRWFRVQSADEAGGQEAGDGDASPTNDLHLYRRQNAAA